MKLKDKNTGKFIGVATISGILTFCYRLRIVVYGFRREVVGFLGDSCHNHFVLDNRGFDSVAYHP